MNVDVEIDPADLSTDELVACLEYAQARGINTLNKGITHPFESFCDEDYAEELLNDMYQYFSNTSMPAPQPVRDFFWHVYGKLV